MRVIRNLDRTLLKVRWQAGGECVVFPEDLRKSVRASDVDDVCAQCHDAGYFSIFSRERENCRLRSGEGI